ncbi:hypothetical protein Cgig2_018650 [Carnegiea gigantea]|uniref:DNA mismatch repair proteins mutS family domain-containing protein n=1 Tax=Carnegiea gigantea TaxID=171969 RepID=A0A9Q1QHV9_9CARY|nr:hypothetical protein Cgig2_018650 [Carnegiea gigantea]
MHRQRSILSFLKKPSPENPNSATSARDQLNGAGIRHNPSGDTLADASKPTSASCIAVPSLEIRGTDTPPEKAPRQILTADLTPTDDKKSSVFSSIMHKFVKVDAKEKSSDRNQGGGCPSNVWSMFDIFNECQEASECNTTHKAPENPAGLVSNGMPGQFRSVDVRSDANLCGPETPGERPFVPRLKRIQEDGTKFDDRSDFSVRNSNKRVKFLQDPKPGNNLPLEVSETASKFEWLDPSRIRDANRRRPGDPFYDKRTLYIPPDVLKKMSASQKQYWTVKCQYMDVLLFFKVGKFYELYEIDAEIGHRELDWKVTNSGVGKCRQVGISESGIDDAVQKLVARGYKVGRMEQLETADQVKARGATTVIPRKLVNVITPSTSTDENIGPDAVHLLAIKEGSRGVDGGSTTYGFAFVDCAALKIWVGSVSDDASCAALMALLMQVSPKEIIYENRGLSRDAQKVLKKYSSSGSKEVQTTPVLPVNGFLDAGEVKNMIQSKKYFKGSEDLWNFLLDGVTHHEFTLCALGGLIDHLSRLMLDDILCNGEVLPYQVYKGCLRMDGQTLVNLEVFHNNADGGSTGTLFRYLDNCITPAGKRLLRSWICHPLKDVEEINDRLNVVEALTLCAEIMLLVAQYLRKVPDLERLLGKVKSAVQSQATLLLPVVGRKALKQRVKAFGSLVKGLRVGMDLLILLQNEEHVNSLLSKILNLPVLSRDNGLNEFLKQFEAAIDSDFPKYQDHDPTDADAKTLSILIELFVEKANQWSQDTDCQHARTLLLTGPNMGGKSTLLRAACLAVIMAQLGCYVPCETCVLSAADMIFTRLGAVDRIMSGESTFYIECAETASVLQNATQDSLVLLDELGRGTSTFDGYAIAYAVFRHLTEQVKCRLLFATHYHPLTKEFASHPHVSLQHMACAMRPRSPLGNKDYELVFLYRLASGACPESYGLQVALMAGIPKAVVEAATAAAWAMKEMIGENFKSSEQRSEFSTLHEDWLKAVLAFSSCAESNFNYDDDDAYDTLFCLWHELKNSYASSSNSRKIM